MFHNGIDSYKQSNQQYNRYIQKICQHNKYISKHTYLHHYEIVYVVQKCEIYGFKSKSIF